jgi:hypothetical protein
MSELGPGFGFQHVPGEQNEFDKAKKKKSWLEKLFPYDPERRKAVKAGAAITGAVVLGGAGVAAEKAGIIKSGENPDQAQAAEDKNKVVAAMETTEKQQAARDAGGLGQTEEGAAEEASNIQEGKIE